MKVNQSITHTISILRGGLIVAEMKVESDVTGKVWKIEKNVGDTVEEDDAIIILESMKMEIPIAAPEDGKILEILVEEGDPVEEGQEVAVMDV